MKIIPVESITPPGEEVAIFQGSRHGASLSFFIVKFSPGKGPRKHRHPYEETFLILSGEIVATVDGNEIVLREDNIVIIPPGTWHEFSNRSETPVFMVNLHPVPDMVTEWA